MLCKCKISKDLVIKESCTLTGHNLLPESFVLQQLEEVKADRVLEETHISRLLKKEESNVKPWIPMDFSNLPVGKVVQVVDKAGVLHEASLSKEMQVIGVGKALDKLHLHLECWDEGQEQHGNWATRTRLMAGIFYLKPQLCLLLSLPCWHPRRNGLLQGRMLGGVGRRAVMRGRAREGGVWWRRPDGAVVWRWGLWRLERGRWLGVDRSLEQNDLG